MKRFIPSALRRHARSESGALTVEALIMFPLLVWAYTAMFVFWDAYKAENLTMRAAYTVADMISRETLDITAGYIDGANSIYAFLGGTSTDNDLRVSVVTMGRNANDELELQLMWSYATGEWGAHVNVNALEPRVPIIAEGAQLIVVEARTGWEPAFNVGLPARDLYDLVVAVPRYDPQVIWNDGTGT
jgi:Flp pilus assembly protein TadG